MKIFLVTSGRESYIESAHATRELAEIAKERLSKNSFGYRFYKIESLEVEDAERRTEQREET